MKRLFAAILFFRLAAAGLVAGDALPAVIPVPAKMELRGAGFQFDRSTQIYPDAAGEVANYLADTLRPATGRCRPARTSHCPPDMRPSP